MYAKYLCVGIMGVAAAAAAGVEYVPDLARTPEQPYGGGDVVEGNNYGKAIEREYAGWVRVLDGDELLANGYLTLGDALREQAGVYVEYLPGAEEAIMRPRVRGAAGNDTLVLIDDVPLNDLASAWAELRAVPIENVRRVEVFPSPAGARHGDGAVGGVIRVYTREGPWEAARTLLSASDGSFDSERYRFNFSVTTRGLDFSCSGNRRLSLEPNTRNASNRNAAANVDGSLGYRGKGGRIRITAGHYAGFDAVLEPFTWEEVINSPARDAPARKEYEQDRVGMDAGGEFGPGSARVRGYYRTGSAGFENYETRRRYQSRGAESAATLGYEIPHGVGSVWAVGFTALGRENLDSHDRALLWEARCVEEYRFSFPARVSAGVAYGGTASSRVFSPTASFCLFPLARFKTYAGLDGGARSPAAGETGRYDEGGVARGVFGGLRAYFPGDAEAGAEWFYNRFERDYVDGWGWTDRVVRRGVEFSARGDVEKWFDWYGSYCYLRAVDGGGREQPFTPRHRGYAKLGRTDRFFRGDLRLRYEARVEYCGERVRADGPGEGAVVYPLPWTKVPYRDGLPGYWQVGGHFSFAVLTFQAYCNVENVNRARDYVVRPGYAVPRRLRTFVGFNWTLFD